MDTNASPLSSRRKALPSLATGIVSVFAVGLVGCSFLQPATPVAERPAPGTNVVHDPGPPGTTPPKPSRPDSDAGPHMADTKRYSTTPMKGAEQLVAPAPAAPPTLTPMRPATEVTARVTPVAAAAAPATKNVNRTANRASVATVASVAAPKELVFKGPPSKPASSRAFLWMGLALSLGVMGAVEWYYAQRRRKNAAMQMPEKVPEKEEDIPMPALKQEETKEPSPEPTPVAAVAASTTPA
jgi:hypothetical protein